MTSKIIVNTIEADTGISSVTFASNINLQNDSSILVSSSGIRLGTGSTIAAPSANEITLSTNSAERFRIDSAGRMLLGTTTEGEANADTLTIAESGNAGITIRSGSSATGSIYFSDATSGGGEYDGWIAYNQNSRYFQFGTAQTERLRIDSSGNLLLMTGEIDMQGGNKTVKTSAGFLQLGTSGSHHASVITSGVERLRIDSDGRLLLGLNSSIGGNAIFQVQGSGNRKAHFHQPDTGGCLVQFTNTTTGTTTTNGLEIGLGGDEQGQIWNYYNSYFRIATNNTERLRIDSSGRIGINHIPNGADGIFNAKVDGSNVLHIGHGSNKDNYFTCGASGIQVFRRAGVETLRIDSSGYVTKPNTPAFFVYKNTTNWSLAANDHFVFDTAELNVGGHYSTSNGRFTAPITARYVFHFFSIYTGNAVGDSIEMYKNGSRINGGDVHFTNDPGNNWDCVHYSRVIQLSSGDYVHMQTRTGHTFHGRHWGGWSGYMLG
jgi:hypothetical protein